MLLFDTHSQDRSVRDAELARTDIISARQAGSLCGLLLERARRTPRGSAYIHFDAEHERWIGLDWQETAAAVGRWQQALRSEGLTSGERVAVMMRNRPEWAFFDLAALGLGLVTVPLFVNDRAENVAHILKDSGARLLLVEGAEQIEVLSVMDEVPTDLARVVRLEADAVAGQGSASALPGLIAAADWLPAAGTAVDVSDGRDSLATIVYTSGTTGRPKGVMLSHGNILWNADASLRRIPALPSDLFVSFLPLSHTLERTAGYYLPMMAGSAVAFARSIPQLAEDLQTLRPTVLISVPRVFERVHGRILEQLQGAPAAKQRLFEAAVQIGWKRFEHRQGRRGWSPELALAPALDRLVGAKVRNRLGGRLRVVVCGGAPLRADIGRFFLALGVPVVQGYGLTEASPVISVNALDDNRPDSIGPALDDVEVRLGADSELLVRSPGVMRGYWGLPKATAEAVDADCWLHTGDQARIDGRHLYITGRLKDIIVLATGEKVPPADLELAIAADPLFEQVLVIGENRPYLTAMVVLSPDGLARLAPELGLPQDAAAAVRDPAIEQVLLTRINDRLSRFPGYAQVKRVAVTDEPWSIDAGLMTPTMKLRRARIAAQHDKELADLYAGHV
jgi:long-chain acyl-CoA synthetase